MNIEAAARHALRDQFHGGAFLERCVRDIRHLLLPNDTAADTGEGNIVYLWDGSARTVSAGMSYGEDA